MVVEVSLWSFFCDCPQSSLKLFKVDRPWFDDFHLSCLTLSKTWPDENLATHSKLLALLTLSKVPVTFTWAPPGVLTMWVKGSRSMNFLLSSSQGVLGHDMTWHVIEWSWDLCTCADTVRFAVCSSKTPVLSQTCQNHPSPQPCRYRSLWCLVQVSAASLLGFHLQLPEQRVDVSSLCILGYACPPTQIAPQELWDSHHCPFGMQFSPHSWQPLLNHPSVCWHNRWHLGSRGHEWHPLLPALQKGPCP